MQQPAAAASRWPGRNELREGAQWLGVVGVGLLLTLGAVHLRARVGTAAAPFSGTYGLRLRPTSLLAPAVAVAVVLAVRRGLHEQVAWRPLLGLGYVAAVAWALALALVDGGSGLAGPVSNPADYTADLGAVGDDPVGFVRHFDAQVAGYGVATRTHPPAPLLLLWALHHVGVTRPAVVGLVLTLLGSASVVLVAVAVRSLCHERAARRLLPVLVLAPYALWLAVSMDGVTATVCAAALACGVVGSERDRPRGERVAWAAAAGLLLGVAALFSYSPAWLGASLVAVYFVRRQILLNVVTGVSALLPLTLFRVWGFVWPVGLTAAQRDFSLRVGPHRSWLLWIGLDVLLLVIACGPALLRGAFRWRLTPGWPFLVGAAGAVIFAIASGLSRGEVERSFLPFYPWLLVPAVAPASRPAAPGDEDAGTVPLLLVGLGAGAAVVLEAALRSPW